MWPLCMQSLGPGQVGRWPDCRQVYSVECIILITEGQRRLPALSARVRVRGDGASRSPNGMIQGRCI